ncbi:hypothetical protein PG996_015927 [Apiospora saccharicola]|uniref:Ankyrin n=1 Tax=Apiospora saccharicola TaxID=335842 RepID=A0ABR1TMG5_9PEZI
MAVMANQFEAAKLLVENGADVNMLSKQYNNTTALIQTVKVGSLPMTHLLSRKGANWKHRTPSDNMSAFLQAVYLGQVECTIYLLALGADIHEEGTIGWRPIHYAASKGRTEVVRWLLSMGADKSTRTRGAETAEDLARAGGHHDVVAFLAAGILLHVDISCDADDESYGKGLVWTEDPYPGTGLTTAASVVFSVDNDRFFETYADLLTRPTVPLSN